jgi:hypothetical protein
MTRRDGIEVIEELKMERYHLAKVIFWGGSVPKNLGTRASGLDLVIVYDTLPRPLREGYIYDEWPEPSELSKELKQKAVALLHAGPMLSENDLNYKKFLIIDLLKNLKSTKSPHEKFAIATRLYELLGEFYLLSRNKWSGQGRELVQRLTEVNRGMADSFYKSFQLFFTSGNPQKIHNLANKILLTFSTSKEYEFQLEVS